MKFLLVLYYRYQSTLFGSFQTVELIETFMNYQVYTSFMILSISISHLWIVKSLVLVIELHLF